MTIKIIIPKAASELEDGRKLGYEYVETIGKNDILAPYFQGQNFLAEIDKMPVGYEPPNGIYLIVYADNQPAGIVSLRRFDLNTCEMKRLFVSPLFRGIGLGKLLAERVMEEAKKLGYFKMRLDNSRSVMAKAVTLYRSLGFYEI